MLRIITILLLVFVVVSLFHALFNILRDRSSGTRTVRSLTVRVAVSVALFFMIMIAVSLGFFPGA